MSKLKHNDWPYFGNSNYMMISGPCSAEGPKQIDTIAKKLVEHNIQILRAGVWKPRTRPGSFEGMGKIALPWLQDAQKKYGIKIAIEVANPNHIEEALSHNIDILWIGARTTANPFATQELANCLRGIDIPILIKNPTNPDTSLWLGAIERIEKAGITKIGAIHRSVSQFKKIVFRNNPQWEMAFQLKNERPDLLMLCDPSHIAGKSDLVPLIAQTALELKFDGLMVENHPSPKTALSDPNQQLDMKAFDELMALIQVKNQDFENNNISELLNLRDSILNLDQNIIELLGSRMSIIQKIAAIKKEHGIAIYQEKRWQELMDHHMKSADLQDLNINFIAKLFEIIHLESIDKQIGVMYKRLER